MFKEFGRWLANRRHFLFSWYTKDASEQQEPERSLVSLPGKMRHELTEKIKNLPLNPTEEEAIRDVLNEALNNWRNNPKDTNNSVVILSSPVTPVWRVLTETLETWAKEKQVSLNLFPLAARPEKITTIQSKLETYFAPKDSCQKHQQEELEIAVIPNLNWCFLRSLDGLTAIEYLQDLLCHKSKNRFWIIGGGQVGWEYLNCVCSLEAYCGKILLLPEISGEQLEEWIKPIIEEFEIVFDDPRLDKQLFEGDKDNQTNYFAHLADISEGVSTVAVESFLKSIAYEADENEDEEEAENDKTILVAQTPKLPKLPDLNNSEQYLLYSLLLHEDLTLSALAASLADEEAEVRAIVRVLRRKGVIEQQNRVLKINPIHYPKLKYELAINNFVVNHKR